MCQDSGRKKIAIGLEYFPSSMQEQVEQWLQSKEPIDSLIELMPSEPGGRNVLILIVLFWNCAEKTRSMLFVLIGSRNLF